jgi:hypothetical protein
LPSSAGNNHQRYAINFVFLSWRIFAHVPLSCIEQIFLIIMFRSLELLLLSFYGSLFCIKILRCLVHFFLVWQKAQGIMYRKAPREHVATLSMHVVLRPLHAYTDAPLLNEKKCSKIHRC